MLVLILSGSLAALGGMMGCGDGTPGMTPGTYAYTITATDAKANLSLNTTANVTVRQVKPKSLMWPQHADRHGDRGGAEFTRSVSPAV